MNTKYVLNNGDALVSLNFENARQAIDDYASTTDCDLIAITENIDGSCDILTRNGKKVCFVADYDYIKKLAAASDFEAGYSFFDGIHFVGTYSDEELENL